MGLHAQINEEFKNDILSSEESIIHNREVVPIVVEKDFERCCFDFLRYKIAEENSTINYENFVVHGLPKGEGEALWIVSQTIARSATGMLTSCRDENVIDIEEREMIKSIKKEMAKIEKESAKLEKDLAKEQEKNLGLRKRLENYDETKKKEFEGLLEENNELHYDKTKLEKRNSALEAEIERLKKQMAEMQKTEVEENDENIVNPHEVDVSAVDVNKRYVFVMDENPYGKEQLLQAFPNSSIADDYIEFNPNGVDVVVCITSRVKHNVYNSTKDYCKAKGIPFVHCVKTNAEMIKMVLAELDS